MVADQHGGLRQQQFAKSVEVRLDQVLVPPRQIGHVGDERHFWIVGCGFGDGAQDLRRADEADLDQLHFDVFQDGARLFGNGLFIERKVIEDLGGVACIGACHDRQHMGADRRHRESIAAQSAGAAGVARVENQDAWRIEVFDVQSLVVFGWRRVVKIGWKAGVLGR